MFSIKSDQPLNKSVQITGWAFTIARPFLTGKAWEHAVRQKVNISLFVFVFTCCQIAYINVRKSNVSWKCVQRRRPAQTFVQNISEADQIVWVRADFRTQMACLCTSLVKKRTNHVESVRKVRANLRSALYCVIIRLNAPTVCTRGTNVVHF